MHSQICFKLKSIRDHDTPAKCIRKVADKSDTSYLIWQQPVKQDELLESNIILLTGLRS